MRRRPPDDRPPIEVVGADPGLSSLQHVTTGSSGGGGDRRRGLVVGACVIALVVLGLALGGDDPAPDEDGRAAASDERTTTTRARGPTTTRPTTTTTLPTGPVFGAPVGGSLVVFAGSTWTLVDIDTGARRDLDLASRDAFETTVVRGGVVTLAGDREAQYVDLRSGEDLEPRPLGIADQVVPHPQPDRVWLLDFGGRFQDGSTPEASVARLVDLEGNVLRSVSVPGGYVSAATEEGLLFERGGRVFVVDEDGVRAFGVGYVIGAVGRSALLYTCDEDAECVLELRAPGDRAGQLVDAVPTGLDYGHEVAPRPGGGFALVRYGGGPADGTIGLYDESGRSLGSLEQPSGLFYSRPYWLPGDVGLVTANAGHPTWIHREGGTWVSELIEPLRDLNADAVYVIEP